jgi:hypothetical protein
MSLNRKVKSVLGLHGTSDIDTRTNDFLENVGHITYNGDDTSRLSERQITWIEDLYKKHFVGSDRDD